MIDSALGNNGHNSVNNDMARKNENKQNNGTIRCTARKIFPLADERIENLIYPSITYHYSVSTDARYVYVIGEDPTELRSQLYVWDLHRGVARRYSVINFPPSLQMKHLYEIDYLEGILVCCSSGCFHVYAVRFDHSQELIRIRKTLFYQLNNNSHFWSSARASSERGIIFMSQHDQVRNFYVAQIGLDTPMRSVILTARMSGLRFCGQPWVDGNYMYLFESASITTYAEMKYLTGRLVRANLHTGELEIVRTKATGIIESSLPAVQQQLEQGLPQDATPPQVTGLTTLIRRVKHVGRDGWLWIIAEFVEPYDTLNQDTARCEVLTCLPFISILNVHTSVSFCHCFHGMFVLVLKYLKEK
uniref:CPSF_A domain-containing protein n=1 Tax=Loa loa TaxID=7209 RepID=A0A1I7VMB8_LOALO